MRKELNHHLVILKKPYIDAILAGKKTIESRFYQTRQKWLSQTDAGDKLFLKASSGPVMAMAAIASIRHFDNLTPRQIVELKKQYNQQILGEDQYWEEKNCSRFGILIWLKDVRPIAQRFIKKADWRAWVVLTPNEHFGLLNGSRG